MAEDDDLGDLDLGEEDDDDVVTAADAEALEEAISSVDEDGDEGDDELDPLAEEMLKMMEEEGGDDSSDSGEDVDQMMEMEILKTMEEEGGGGGAASLDAGTGDDEGNVGGVFKERGLLPVAVFAHVIAVI